MSVLFLVFLLGHQAPQDTDPRAELEQVKQLLFANVQQVSRTSSVHPLGLGEPCRAYHLQGIGAFFVLPARVLPTGNPGPMLLIETSKPVPSPKPAGERAGIPAMKERRNSTQRGSDPSDAEIRAMEEQVRAFQQEAQRAHEEAERALERQIEEFQRIREAQAAPRREGSALPQALPLTPPWQGWFFSEEARDPRAPEAVMADVENAVTAALEAGVSRLGSVSPDESLIVAVDFYNPAAFGFPTPPAKTLIIRAKKKDLSEAASGKIGPEELRKRVEYREY